MSGLPWVRLDTRLPMMPELVEVRSERGGDRAALVWLSCLIWAKAFTQDGYIPPTLPPMYGGKPRHSELLVSHELWIPAGRGWVTLWHEDPRPATRAHIPLALRRAVYERDGNACVICGATDRLSLDHIQHWSGGGPDTLENLRTLCLPCNSSRRTRTDEEWLGVPGGA